MRTGKKICSHTYINIYMAAVTNRENAFLPLFDLLIYLFTWPGKMCKMFAARSAAAAAVTTTATTIATKDSLENCELVNYTYNIYIFSSVWCVCVKNWQAWTAHFSKYIIIWIKGAKYTHTHTHASTRAWCNAGKDGTAAGKESYKWKSFVANVQNNLNKNCLCSNWNSLSSLQRKVYVSDGIAACISSAAKAILSR